jgi:HK97 family phage prohead protease
VNERIVRGTSYVRTTAKAATSGQTLVVDAEFLDEVERGYWRERDLGNGHTIVEWVCDETESDDEERIASRYAGTRARDWLAPDPPRPANKDWLAVRPPDKSCRLPDSPPGRRDWLAPYTASSATRLPEAPTFGSWTNPQGSGVGLPVIGRMIPFGEWTEIRSAKEGSFLERFAAGSFSTSIRERGGRIRTLFQHGMDSLLGRQPIAAIEEMWEREDGAHYRSRLLAGVPELVVSGLRAGLYGSSVSFRARQFERVVRPRRSGHNPDRLEERTITEADVYEFSFVTFPQYEGATARVDEAK